MSGRVFLLWSVCVGGAMSLAVWLYVITYIVPAPADWNPVTITIEPGSSVAEIAMALEQQAVIQTAWAMEVWFALRGDSTSIKAGTYTFTEPLALNAVADTLVAGQFDTALIPITFIEGATLTDFATVAKDALVEFDESYWALHTRDAEGYYFPDTYLVPPDFSTQELATLLSEQHNTVYDELVTQYGSSTLSHDEVVILASILEREANDEASMRTVAGIFLNRLDIGMALQADATIEYVLDTPLGELPPGQLAAELREVDSPYNTYKNTGLPPTPIGNPGRQALAAVFNPIASDYLYYITGTDGIFYYGETYAEHLTNIERHLR